MALPHSKNILNYPPRFQFGESGAPCGGSSCCTDTCIKMIVEYYKDATYSLAEIRRRAQSKSSFNEAPCTGINSVEVINALESFGINHYRVAYGANSAVVWNKVAVGPVIVGVHYGSYPNSANSCGSNKAELNGRTDCGFSGAHAVLAVGRRYHLTHRDFYVRDPDHNSPARPEKPKYDIMRRPQLELTMKNLVPYTAFKQTYIIYPTKKK